jgi:N,N-dimethylformamidase
MHETCANAPRPFGLGRRSFLMGGAAALALTALWKPIAANAAIIDLGFPKKTVVGYAWPWTARPGESISFHVSTYAPGPYSAQIVRLICADAMTDHGRHYKEQPVHAALARSYPGGTQQTFLGSFAHVEDVPALRQGDSFTLCLCLYPTAVSRGSELAQGSFAPLTGRSEAQLQHLVSRWHEPTKSGWSLALDARGRPVFLSGDGSGAVERLTLPEPLVLRRWVRLALVHDSASSTVRLVQEPILRGGGDDASRASDRREARMLPPPQKGPLRFGAAVGGPSNTDMPAGAGVLNGKLDKVRLARGALGPSDVRSLQAAAEPARSPARLVGWWDFAKGIGTTRIHDVSGQGLEGVTVNLPVRAVIGADWDGRTLDWREAPGQYSALHCHEDALVDAAWKPGFTYKIPPDARSGIYAARVRHGASECMIPFYVAPARSRPKAKVAFVVPTLTYLAYTSALGVSYWTRKALVPDPAGGRKAVEEEWMPIYREERSATDMALQFGPAFGMGVYRFYRDGNAVYHAPMRIPNLANEPRAILKNCTADTDIIEWLEHDGIDYDVLTDELLHAEGADLLKGYAAVITGSHTEYHTWEMYDAYLAYLNSGGRLMSIGGNAFHNRIAFHKDLPGVVECRKKQSGTAEGNDFYAHMFGEFDGLPTGKFKEIGSAANVIQGLGTVNLEPMTAGTYYKRMPGADDPRAAFVLAGVGRDEKIGNFGKSGGGAASEEIDMADLRDGTPAHALILATASDMVWPMVSEDGLTDPKYQINFNPHADMVFFETPQGGAVFSVGSMGWRASLSHNGFDNNVARITRNVLARFTDPTPFPHPAAAT